MSMSVKEFEDELARMRAASKAAMEAVNDYESTGTRDSLEEVKINCRIVNGCAANLQDWNK